MSAFVLLLAFGHGCSTSLTDVATSILYFPSKKWLLYKLGCGYEESDGN